VYLFVMQKFIVDVAAKSSALPAAAATFVNAADLQQLNSFGVTQRLLQTTTQKCCFDVAAALVEQQQLRCSACDYAAAKIIGAALYQ
jgi:hypothetical protein